MSSIKCPNCDLTNFASALYCKRCNGALQQPLPNAQMQNSTQIYDTAKDTQIRPIVQPRNDGFNQANVQNQYQQNPPNNYGQGYGQNQQRGQQNQNYAQNQNGQQQQNYAQNQYNQPLNQPQNPYNQQNQNQYNQQNHAQNQYGQQNRNYPQNQYGQQNQPYQNRAQQNQQPYQNQKQPNHGQNQQHYQNQNPYKQPPPQNDSYALPQFPKGERPIKFNHYQKNRYQPMLEHPYRKLGSDIALHKNSTLPEVCVRCGQHFTVYSGGRYVAQKFRWHHPAVYAALISPLIYAILAACLSERFTVSVPLCSTHIEKRSNTGKGLMVGSLIAVSLVVLMMMGGYFSFAVFIGIVSAIIISLNFEYGYKSLRVAKVEGSYYHLKGASNEFMHELPY